MAKIFNRDLKLAKGCSIYVNNVEVVDGDGNIDAPVTTTNLTTTGNTALGNAVTDTTTIKGATSVQSTSATALAVGANGATTPALTVDASTASSATGIKVKSAASGGGVAISATGGTNEVLTIDAKGNGTITLGATSTGNISLARPVDGLVSTVTESAHKHVGQIVINMGGVTNALGAATVYSGGSFVATADATGETIAFVSPISGIIKSMYVNLVTAPGGTDTVISTLRIGGADKLTTCTITGASIAGSDFAHPENLSAGDIVTIKHVSGATTAAGLRCSILIQSDTATTSTSLTVATV